MPKTAAYAVPALDKGLDVLEALSAATVPQSLGELAAALNRSSSELFRMLNCLERRGYVAREPVGGRYTLTLRLFALAHAHSPVDQLLRAALVPMRRLVERTGESCHLGVLQQGQLLVIAQEESPRPVRISVAVGAAFDAVETASGRLLLAHLEDLARAAALARSPAWQRASARARAALEKELASIVRCGLSLALDETHQGVRDASALVGRPGVATAALALPVLEPARGGPPAAELHAALRATAAEITAQLGLS